MSTENEEASQEASLALYKEQLSQVNQAIQLQASEENTDLLQLKNDLTELIILTEENLLQLKKARLLKALEESSADDNLVQSGDKPDDEYAAFQAYLAEDLPSSNRNEALSSLQQSHPSPSKAPISSTQKSDAGNISKADVQFDDDDDEDDDEEDEEDVQSALLHMIGTKCQAPIANDWGGHHYGNAMIWSIDTPSELTTSTEYTVRVIFLNPTQPSMVACSFYMDGKCRFSADTCRRSHGQTVFVSQLKPYREPDHSQICEAARCLAKSSDEVWYPATVTDVCDDHLVNVKFDAGGEERTVQIEHIMPLSADDAADSDDSSSDSDSDGEGSSSKKLKTERDDYDDDDVGDEDDNLPVYLWKPSGTTDRLGAWEDHTKGVGSRLMAKMGYVTGQGLGPRGEGRAEPVPIMLLPQGKSLDKIMELKEMAGNADLFNAMKKMEKQQKAMEKKAEEREKRREAKSNWGVFGFLNKKLHTHVAGKSGASRGQASSSKTPQAVTATVTSSKELGKRSDKDVNLQIFKTSEEMRAVERHLVHLRQQLARNETRDRKMAAQVRQKIEDQEAYLRQLKSSSQTLESHKQRRSAHKKLTVF